MKKKEKYTAKEEFVYLIYNDIIRNFTTEWEGYYLRKQVPPQDNPQLIDETEEYNYDVIEDQCRPDDEFPCISETLKFKDEFSNISFVSNNSYSGRTSRKMMEGEGIYKWHNGVQYKGQFEQNRIQGKGLIEWNNDCWYEGDFANNYRHGKGTMVDRERNLLYTGQWSRGCKHGTGYCRYAENNSYDGDWRMNRKEGNGLRIYADGTRYTGQWKNDRRHGTGTMVWPNGDVYRGEWKDGEMQGYGKYTWNGFFNKTLSWPQEAAYVGEWYQGMRHGKGSLILNSSGGAKYIGYWKQNAKHGYGIIIGNNGEVTEGDPLFVNDILISSNDMKTQNEIWDAGKQTEICDQTSLSIKISEPRITNILKPEQFPSLRYYVSRLFNLDFNKEYSLHSLPSGKCNVCNENAFCSCLIKHSAVLEDKEQIPTLSENDNSEIFREKSESEKNHGDSKDSLTNEQYEEHWLYNCIVTHMQHLRWVYYTYAKVYANNAPNCNLVMVRLCLWQLWRDCGIPNKGLTLIEIDKYIAMNKCMLIEDPYYPFERLEIWQFLCALVEVSWHLYTKHGNIAITVPGKLAGGFHRFLINDVYPNVGNHIGFVPHEYRDLLPIYSVFQLYRKIGYPLPARNLLAACVTKESDLPDMIVPEYLWNGMNCVTVGDRISYLPNLEESITSKSAKMTNTFARDLSVFEELGVPKLVEIIAKVCPSVKDARTGIIVNINYELTFLEFYEVVIEATIELLHSRKIKEGNQEVSEKALPVKNNSLQKEHILSVVHPTNQKKIKKEIHINKRMST